MTTAPIKSRTVRPFPIPPAVRSTLIGGGAIAIVLYTVGVTPETLATSYRPRVPDFSVLAGIPLVLSIHIAAAITALLVGLVIMAAPKGRGMHKALGWSWVIAMAVTGLSSFGLLLIPGVEMTLIHGLSAYVLIALPMGVAAIRRGDIKRHRSIMTGLSMGALASAAVLTLLPGRLMWRVFFG
jgi:uncharacterized membrane protein